MNDLTIKQDQDIEYSSFLLHKTGLAPIGNPTFEQWEQVGKFIRKAEGAVHFWIGDWLNYGENKWGEMYAQAMDTTEFDYQTLKNDKWIAGKIPLSVRTDHLGLQHAQTIASLPQEEMKYWAEEIAKEAIPVRELKKKIQARKKALMPKPELPEGLFNVIYVDPPWEYDFSETDSRKIENQYPTMTVEELKGLQIPSTENAVLFMWATAPKIREALEVMQSWGFEYKTNAVWDKEIVGMGYWFRGQHELLFIGVKGSFSPPEEGVRVSSVFRDRRTQHSKKPDLFYSLIESYFPEGKYLELFARNGRENWESWGNQL